MDLVYEYMVTRQGVYTSDEYVWFLRNLWTTHGPITTVTKITDYIYNYIVIVIVIEQSLTGVIVTLIVIVISFICVIVIGQRFTNYIATIETGSLDTKMIQMKVLLFIHLFRTMTASRTRLIT